MPFHSLSERNTYRWNIKEVQLHLHDNQKAKMQDQCKVRFNMEVSPLKSVDFTEALCLPGALGEVMACLFRLRGRELINSSAWRKIKKRDLKGEKTTLKFQIRKLNSCRYFLSLLSAV